MLPCRKRGAGSEAGEKRSTGDPRRNARSRCLPLDAVVCCAARGGGTRSPHAHARAPFTWVSGRRRPPARSPRLVEGDRRLSPAGRHHRPALGKAGGHAGAPAPARPDGVGLRLPGRARCVGPGRRFTQGAAAEVPTDAAPAAATGPAAPVAEGDAAHGERQGVVAPPSTAPPARHRSQRRWGAVGLGLLVLVGAGVWMTRSRERDVGQLFAEARFQQLTDFEGVEQAAAISRDGRFVAFQSDHAGQMDVWVTQVGTGRFSNLTHGTALEMVNPSVRTLGFSPDMTLVTFWARGLEGSGKAEINIWGVPLLGGPARPYLEGVAEYDWSADGERLAYHTPGPGDPLFVRDPGPASEPRQIFSAPAGLHSHFPLWAPDQPSLYFVQGALPDRMDLWRIEARGGTPERLTRHESRVSHPVFLGPRTLLYLMTDPDGSGPWMQILDLRPAPVGASARGSIASPPSRRARTGGASWPRARARRPHSGARRWPACAPRSPRRCASRSPPEAGRRRGSERTRCSTCPRAGRGTASGGFRRGPPPRCGAAPRPGSSDRRRSSGAAGTSPSRCGSAGGRASGSSTPMARRHGSSVERSRCRARRPGPPTGASPSGSWSAARRGCSAFRSTGARRHHWSASTRSTRCGRRPESCSCTPAPTWEPPSRST